MLRRVGVLVTIGDSLREAFFMFWVTLWALVLGFGLSGVVQAFVSRGQMQQALGDHRTRTIVRGSLLGMASSSCSYAASALAKSLFRRGADFTAAMVFMVASTNLVLELGIVLWLLIGWQFAVAEFVGGAVMIGLLAVLLPRIIPGRWIESARQQLNDVDPAEHAAVGATDEVEITWRAKLRQPASWADAAGYTVADLTMLRREIVIGFVAAGFISEGVPVGFWNAVFLHGHGSLTTVENSVVGPFVAVISFVCSIGNVPLAAALWKDGIGFGGVVAFVFADLISLPLLSIYRKFYGGRITLRLLAVFWLVMSSAGLVTELIFKGFRIAPTSRPVVIAAQHFSWNYTTSLNICFIAVFAGILWLHRRRSRFGGGEQLAIDPICGMQVEKQNAGATLAGVAGTTFFCSDHCRDRFREHNTDLVAEPARGGGHAHG